MKVWKDTVKECLVVDVNSGSDYALDINLYIM